MTQSQISEKKHTHLHDRDIVGWIAVQIERVLSPGALSELRRITPENPWCPTVWRLLADQKFDPLLSGNDDQASQSEKKWSFIIHIMALTAGLHEPSKPVGQVLAALGFSELRLNRLLKAQDNQILDQVSSVARYLKSKGESFNLIDLALLFLTGSGTEKGDRIRSRIARSYFTTLAKSEKE